MPDDPFNPTIATPAKELVSPEDAIRFLLHRVVETSDPPQLAADPIRARDLAEGVVRPLAAKDGKVDWKQAAYAFDEYMWRLGFYNENPNRRFFEGQ